MEQAKVLMYLLKICTNSSQGEVQEDVWKDWIKICQIFKIYRSSDNLSANAKFIAVHGKLTTNSSLFLYSCKM